MQWLIVLATYVACVQGTNSTIGPAKRPAEGQTDVVSGKMRIYGGRETQIEEVPYQLAIVSTATIYPSHQGGASIISANWALTAAHCVQRYRKNPKIIQLRSGSNQLNVGGDLHNANKIIVHAQYDTMRLDYDIAVIRVEPAFAKSASTAIVNLAGRPPAPGKEGIISGWGWTLKRRRFSTILHSVNVPIVSDAGCAKVYGEDTFTKRMLCAGYVVGGKDSCNGDSGGPLVVDGLQVGIVSFGKACGKAGYPGVYTNVASLSGWIHDQTGVPLKKN